MGMILGHFFVENLADFYDCVMITFVKFEVFHLKSLNVITFQSLAFAVGYRISISDKVQQGLLH